MSCSFGTIPFKKERIVKPAESLSVKISIPLVSAKRRISFCLFLSLNIPNPSVSIIRVSSIFDTFILSYWCNHGTADDDTIALIQKMKGKNLIVIGTLGADRASKHAEDVCRNVSALASENNRLLGHFLCRGSVDLKRTARRLAIPEGEKGHLSQERFEKQKLSQGHPDETDLENARAAVKEFLEKL